MNFFKGLEKFSNIESLQNPSSGSRVVRRWRTDGQPWRT